MLSACMSSLVDGMLSAFETTFTDDESSTDGTIDGSWLMLGYGLGAGLGMPVWGFLGDSHSRLQLMAMAAATIGIFTLASAFVASFLWLCVLRTLTGIVAGGFLSINAIIADSFIAEERGRAISLIALFNIASGRVTIVIATNASEMVLKWGYGWQVQFLCVAAFALIVATSLSLSASAEQRPTDPDLGQDRAAKSTGKPYASASCSARVCTPLQFVARAPTFWLLTTQGVMLHVAWSSLLGFGTLWLQTAGLSDALTSVVFICLAVGNVVGTIACGFVGDFAASWRPNTGRVLVSLVSMATTLIFASATLFAIPLDSSPSATPYAACIFLLAFFAAGSNSGTAAVMLTEVVPVANRTSLIGLALAIEKCLGTILASSPGFIANALGYEAIDTTLDSYYNSTSADLGQAAENAEALRGALAVCTIVPWVLSLSCSAAIYFTFAHDRDRAAATPWTFRNS